MGFMDKMKNFMAVNDDEFDENEEYDYEENREEPVRRESSKATNDYFSDSSTDDYSSTNTSNKRFVNIHANSQLSVVLVKPESFADASGIADHLNNKRTVVLNLESTSKDVSRRLVDFLSGVAYANRGQLKRVANCTYIVTPYNVDIMGDVLLDEIENSGMYI